MSSHTFGLAGIMGWPVAHSRSPLIHNHWIQKYGLTGAYVQLPVAPGKLDIAIPGLAALGFRGCNITLPHKVDALQLMDEVDANARRMGAMNTIVVQPDGSLKGFNNDGFGYIQSLLDAKPDWRADAGPVTVLGAGGAARAVVLSLADRGAKEIRLLNRSPEKAQALADVRSAAADAAVAAASTILSQSVKGQVADDLLAKGIQDVREKLN